jgi:hypothetical protein
MTLVRLSPCWRICCRYRQATAIQFRGRHRFPEDGVRPISVGTGYGAGHRLNHCISSSQPRVAFVGRLLVDVKFDPEEKPPPVIRIAHLPNAFSISLRSASARVVRWADAYASIDFTNSTGIRVQMSGLWQVVGLPGRLAFALA